MRLVFLGVGGSALTPERHTAGVYLPEHGILLDGGTNVYPLRDLHDDRPLHVLLSHYHLDHSIGLFFLAAGLFQGRATPKIRVFGPDWHDRFAAAAGPEAPLFPIPLPFEMGRAPKRFDIGPVKVRTRPLRHTAPALGYRFDLPGGETLAYISDTTAPGDYLEFIRGVDVLIHECTFRLGSRAWAEETGHSEPEGLGRLAREAGVGTLFLTHIGPVEDGLALRDEVRQFFPAAELPVEGLEYPRDVAVDSRRAVFPGSFDPLTVSHLDIIRTCVDMFDGVRVVVGRNRIKDAAALFTPEERAELIRRCVPPSVAVDVWGGLTVEYARKVQAGRIVRGLGRAEDYTVEVRLWKTNALLAPEMQTVWVPPRAENLDISSSMIKEAASFGGWEGVKQLIPEPIRDEVGARIAERRAAAPPSP
jgi:ribonuclease Z